jgi:hypothetical protein
MLVFFLALMLPCAGAMSEATAPDEGLMVISLAIPKDAKAYSGVCVQYRRTDRAGSARMLCWDLVPPALRPDIKREDEILRFEDESFVGAVRSRSLAAGQYELYWYNLAGIGHVIQPKKELAIPFTVKAGVSTYLGQYRWTLTRGTTSSGKEGVTGATLAVSDQRSRDLERAAKLGPIPNVVEVALPGPVNASDR